MRSKRLAGFSAVPRATRRPPARVEEEGARREGESFIERKKSEYRSWFQWKEGASSGPPFGASSPWATGPAAPPGSLATPARSPGRSSIASSRARWRSGGRVVTELDREWQVARDALTQLGTPLVHRHLGAASVAFDRRHRVFAALLARDQAIVVAPPSRLRAGMRCDASHVAALATTRARASRSI
jgi:hypothetical protein